MKTGCWLTVVLLGLFTATACGGNDAKVASTSLSEFAATADAVCIGNFSKVNALRDPDGGGGNKPLGLGRVVREWADDLAAITAPDAFADEWAKATRLLRRSGVRLSDAERLAAEGDATGSGAAQSEALWSLQPQAAEIIARLEIPFRACFVE